MGPCITVLFQQEQGYFSRCAARLLLLAAPGIWRPSLASL